MFWIALSGFIFGAGLVIASLVQFGERENVTRTILLIFGILFLGGSFCEWALNPFWKMLDKINRNRALDH